MNLKEFLRPTKGKIIILILIFILSLFFGFKESYVSVEMEGGYRHLEFNKVFFPLSQNIYYIPSYGLSHIITFIVIYLCGIIYWYSLACLIIFLYQKIKSIKK